MDCEWPGRRWGFVGTLGLAELFCGWSVGGPGHVGDLLGRRDLLRSFAVRVWVAGAALENLKQRRCCEAEGHGGRLGIAKILF